jgi:hypothetical protein
MQHTDVGQIANLPRFRQVRNLPHVADFLRRSISSSQSFNDPIQLVWMVKRD